jgi:hypothetical protein
MSIDWNTHKHVFTSELGWQGKHFGSLVCECSYPLPYETPSSGTEGLTHELCWLLGIRCNCEDCDSSRALQVTEDMRRHYGR